MISLLVNEPKSLVLKFSNTKELKAFTAAMN